MRKRTRLLTVAAAAAVAAGVLVPMSAAAAGQSFPVPGLTKPVSMAIDTWGVPHITASNVGDLFQAQGFSVARDRLFQIDTWRRRGLGELSEVLGPKYVEQDRATRMFLYRGDMNAEWNSYGPLAKEAATRFAAGINAYVDWLAKNPGSVPEEFTKLGYQPAHWKPEDLVRIRSHAIGNNLAAEVGRARLACLAGDVGSSKYYRTLEPDHTPKAPGGIDPCSIPADVMTNYNLATQNVTFPQGTGESSTEKALSDASSGSNSWAVSGKRTATGRPILASDPHREDVFTPTDRYITHLSAPGIDIIGAGEPWNPGVSIGHNQNIAFGLTNLPADQTDLYVYQLDPNDPTKYKYGNGWEQMRTVTESVPVKGGAAQKVDMQFTRHGPVVKVDAAKHLAYAVRSVWSQPGTSAYLGSLNFQSASNFSQFKQAMDKWNAPGSNLTYADTNGDIGWVPGALVPKRTGADYDGLLPVPGDGRYEWNGFYRNDEFPSAHNPAAGYFVSANDYNFPKGAPVPTYEYSPPYRRDRIAGVLAGQSKTSIADTITLQNDQKSAVATALVPYLAKLTSTDPTATKAIAFLRDYDGVTSKESGKAALFETWIMTYLYPAWAHIMLPSDAADQLVKSNIDPDFRQVTASFANPDQWFGSGGAAKRDALINDTLAKSWNEVSAKLGADPAKWQWGSEHIHAFVDPVSMTPVGAIPQGGSFHTVRASFYNYQTFPRTEVLGPTFKMAVDVGAWDNSMAINAPGQSGDKRSPHYQDLNTMWANNQYFPLLYSKSAIDKHVETTIELNPA